MAGIGVLLVVLGIGSLVLPMLNMQFRLMEFVDPYQPFAGIIVAVIGLALLGLAMQRRSAKAAPPVAESPVAASAPATSAAPAASEATAAPADADTDRA